MNMPNKNIEVLKKRINRCITELANFVNYIYKHRGNEKFYEADWHQDIIDELQEGVYLINSFNNLDLKDVPKVRKFSIDEKKISYLSMGEVITYLKNILREIQVIQDYLSAFLRPDLSESEKSKIDSLRKELDILESEACDPIIIKNLSEALKEGEFDHSLACGIISARIIIDRIEKIEGESDEEKLSNMVKRGVIDKDEKSKESSKFFLDAAKSARNAVTHKIKFLPQGSEALTLLSYAFRICNLINKYINKKDETNTK